MTLEEFMKQSEIETITLKKGDCLVVKVPMDNVSVSDHVQVLTKIISMLKQKLPKGVTPIVISKDVELMKITQEEIGQPK